MNRLAPLLLLAVLATAPAVPARAQHALGVDGIDPAFIEQTRRLAGDRITLCVNADSVLAPFDRAVAAALANALLLEVDIAELGTPYRAPRFDDRLLIEQTDLFVAMSNTCDGLLGYRLAAGGIPDWLTVSAPYFRTRSVMATLDPAIGDIGALPPGAAPIGARMGGPGDAALRTYLRATFGPSATRLGYPDNEVLLARLADGTLCCILIWEPALVLGGPEKLGTGDVHVFAPPFDAGTVDFGVAVPAGSAYLRAAFDQAIAALDAGGALDALAREHGLPTLPHQ